MIARAFGIGLLLLAAIASALAVVQTRHKSRLAFVELSRLGKERDELQFEYGRLQLEQATWAEANRIDQVARGRLGMSAPVAADVVLVKR